MLHRLPSLVFWGVRVKALNEVGCTVVMKHRWTNQNPFGSIYFSALNGAAELSTGLLCQLHLQGTSSFSMLVVGSKSTFTRKAKGRIRFICEEGNMVSDAIYKLTEAGMSTTFVLHSTAFNEEGQELANFEFTWSVMRK